LGSNHRLVKILVDGKYGILNLITDEIEAVPVFDQLQFHSTTDTIWAKRDGYYYVIDQNGNRTSNELIAEKDWMYIDQSDVCPKCKGGGCFDCYGFGVVPIGGDYEAYFND